jgi:hypothetical protein
MEHAMKLKDVYITVSKDRELKVVPRSAGKPALPFIYEDSTDPEEIRQCFGMIGFLVEDGETFEELMKVEDFREIRDAHRLQELDLGLDPKKVGLGASKLYALLAEQLKAAAHKGMTDKQIKQWYRSLVAERKTAA